MTGMDPSYLFSNKCSGCGKEIKTVAIDRMGTLPVVYCNDVCKSDKAKRDKIVNNRQTVRLTESGTF
ncbi:MAG: hypothetical protein V1858_02125 [Candidatus Gottesmanbacteria bacterium]